MRRLARGLGGTVALLAIAAAALQAQSADPSALAAGWVRESWSIADGLPVNSINGLPRAGPATSGSQGESAV